MNDDFLGTKRTAVDYESRIIEVFELDIFKDTDVCPLSQSGIDEYKKGITLKEHIVSVFQVNDKFYLESGYVLFDLYKYYKYPIKILLSSSTKYSTVFEMHMNKFCRFQKDEKAIVMPLILNSEFIRICLIERGKGSSDHDVLIEISRLTKVHIYYVNMAKLIISSTNDDLSIEFFTTNMTIQEAYKQV